MRHLRRLALALVERVCSRSYASPHLQKFFDLALPQLLVRRLASEMDTDMLERVLPEQRRVQLGECLPAGILFKTVWSLASTSSLRPPIIKRVECEHKGGSFVVELDLTKTPDCGYYFYDVNPLLTKALEHTRHRRTMIDVGANNGFYSLVASLFFDRVEAFEPCARTFKRLTRNIELSSKANVRAHQLGLSSRGGLAPMLVCESTPGQNSVVTSRREADRETEMIQLATLDDLVKRLRLDQIDFVKIDVEGHELHVLGGGRDTLERWRPDLFVECHDDESLRGCARLLPSGYRPWDLLANRPCRLEELIGRHDRYLDILFRSDSSK